jgi:signal transduction histidine kinase
VHAEVIPLLANQALLSKEITSSPGTRPSQAAGSNVQLMPSWLALVRRARRPGPLFLDAALALALAALSLLTVETSGSQVSSPIEPGGGPEIYLSSSANGLGPGDPWNLEITVVQHGNPLTPFKKIEPRLTIQNTKTGEATTYEAKPTQEFGVYRVRAVFPDKGVYAYGVDVGGFERTVGIGESAAAAPSPSPAVDAGSDLSALGPVALLLLATLPIALRRRYPLPVLAVTLAAALVLDVFYNNFFFPGAVVALYTVAAHVGRPGSLRIGVGTALALTITFLDKSGIEDLHLSNWQDVAGRAAMYAVFTAAWLLGDNLRTRRAYLGELEKRAARLEREREENVRRAAAEEQARIARELHDIIAHNVSVMTVQAAAAGDVFETQPGRVREALGSIESTGREALTELRRLLGSVRPDNGLGTFAPQPGLARLDGLIEQVRAAGLAVELTVEGSPYELPPGVDLSAYRIVQEALTNTLKHARASRVSVLVRYGAAVLELEIVDDGLGATPEATERGHGIIGMRERAALIGADLHVGPAQDGGFAVNARIPLEEAAA